MTEFKTMWRGVLHHVTGRHEWIDDEGGIATCQHISEFEEKKDLLLKPGSDAHKALQQIILNPRTMKNVPYFVNFR